MLFREAVASCVFGPKQKKKGKNILCCGWMIPNIRVSSAAKDGK